LLHPEHVFLSGLGHPQQPTPAYTSYPLVIGKFLIQGMPHPQFSQPGPGMMQMSSRQPFQGIPQILVGETKTIPQDPY